MTNEQKLKRLQTLLETANADYATTKEVADITVAITKEIKSLRESISKSSDSFEKELLKLLKDHNTLSKSSEYSSSYLSKEINNLKNALSNLKLQHGRDGKDADTTEVALEASKMAVDECMKMMPVMPKIDEEIVKNGESVRDSLELLTGEDRLDASAIKNLPEFTTKVIQNTNGGVMGIKGLVAGTNIVIDNSNLQYPKISSTGGGAGSVESVTGLNTDNTDPTNPIVQISVDGVTITGAGTPASPLTAITGGSGDVTGPAGATDEAVARYDTATGKLIQNSVVTIDDAGIVSGATQLNVDNIRIDGNTISSTDTNGDVILAPNGTGEVLVSTMHARTSAGLTIHNASHQDIALFGPGGGQSATFYDGVKLDASTASRVLSTDANKNITALDTTTYPNLTELAYVKGTTSAIQTQLNNKLPLSISTDTYFTTGILSRTDNTLSFDDTTHVFSMTPTGADFSFYSQGVKYTKSVAQTIDLDSVVGFGTNTTTFIYFDSTGTLQGSITPWSINSNNAPVATLFWNGTNGIIGDERHSATRNLAWHEWAHKAVGTRYISGLAGTFATGSTTIATGSYADEDIIFSPAQQTSVLIWNMAPGGAAITTDNTPVSITAKVTAGALKYDNMGTSTSVTSGYYVRNFVYATNNTANPIAVVVGQVESQYLADARIAPLPVFPTYISNETKLLYSVIWQNVGGTPTFVEASDYRTAPTQPNGGIGVRPVFLNDLDDVIVTNPAVDNVLKFNGTDWVVGAPATSSASSGVEFYQASPTITATGTNNSNFLATLSKTPVTTTEQTVTSAVTTNTVLHAAWLYNTALGRTSIDAGTWEFETYAGVNSVAGGRVSTITRQIYSVLTQDGASYTVTITGTGTSRTATASGGTPFATTKIDASATNTTASYLQTPQGLYQITARTSDTVVTITTPTTYSNESAVTFNVWKKLFGSTSPTITAISPNYAQYTHISTQSAFTITVNHKIGSIAYATSNNTTTVTTTYDGTARNSHVNTPLKTLHGDLAGLQGGTGAVPTEEYYHLTAAEYTALSGLSNSQLVGTNVSGDLTSLDTATYPSLTELSYVKGVTSGIQTQLNAKGVGDMTLAGTQSVTGAKTFDKDKILMKGTSTGATTLSTAQTDASSYTQTMQARNGTIANLDNVTYIGTTSVALNRGSGALSLAGVTTDGNLALAGGTMTGAITTKVADGIIMPSGSGICLKLPATDAYCTGNYTDSFQSGATVAASNLVYMGSSSKWLICDADAIATSGGLIGIAMEAKNDTQAMKVALPGSFVRFDAWNWTPGVTLYVSETAGGIATAIPTGADGVIRVIGFAVDADTIYFNPSSDNSTVVA